LKGIRINSINKQKFAFVDQFRQDEVENLTVKLPAVNGKPDFEKIEEIFNKLQRIKTNEYTLILE